MNRRRLFLVLGAIPFLAQRQAALAAAPEQVVIAPNVCVHHVDVTTYCPACAGQAPDPSLFLKQGGGDSAATNTLSL